MVYIDGIIAWIRWIIGTENFVPLPPACFLVAVFKSGHIEISLKTHIHGKTALQESEYSLSLAARTTSTFPSSPPLSPLRRFE